MGGHQQLPFIYIFRLDVLSGPPSWPPGDGPAGRAGFVHRFRPPSVVSAKDGALLCFVGCELQVCTRWVAYVEAVDFARHQSRVNQAVVVHDVVDVGSKWVR